jgi:FMN phosphatase YigB (HAD superfamily)
MSPKKKPVVIFDVDFTVFDTAAFRKNLYHNLAELLDYADITQFNKLAKETEQETKEIEGYFRPRVFLALLQRKAKKGVSLEALANVFFDEQLYIESLYEGAREVFQELVMKRDIAVVIFSKGEKEFHMHKISPLRDMLKEDHIHIFADKIVKLQEVLAKYEAYHIYLVDDFLSVLSEAKKYAKDLTTIWVNRDKKIQGNDIFATYDEKISYTPDKIITDLKALLPFID